MKLGIDTGEEFAANRSNGASGHDALRRATGSHQCIDAGTWNRGHECAGDIAGRIHRDPRARRQYLADEFAMARLLQDEDRQLRNFFVENFGEGLELLSRGPGRVDLAARGRARHKLLHIEGRARVHHGATWRHGENGERVGEPANQIARALHRIDGDVRLEGSLGTAEVLATLGLGGLARGGLTNDHKGVYIDLGQRIAHGVERGTTAIIAIATPNPIEGGTGRPLSNAAQRIDEFRIDLVRGLHNISSSGNLFKKARKPWLTIPYGSVQPQLSRQEAD